MQTAFEFLKKRLFGFAFNDMVDNRFPPRTSGKESSDYQDYVTLPFNTSRITFKEFTTFVILSEYTDQCLKICLQ